MTQQEVATSKVTGQGKAMQELNGRGVQSGEASSGPATNPTLGIAPGSKKGQDLRAESTHLGVK